MIVSFGTDQSHAIFLLSPRFLIGRMIAKRLPEFLRFPKTQTEEVTTMNNDLHRKLNARSCNPKMDLYDQGSEK